MDFTYALWVTSIVLWIFTMMIEANTLSHDRPLLPTRNKTSIDTSVKRESSLLKPKKSTADRSSSSSRKSKKKSKSYPSLLSSSSSPQKLKKSSSPSSKKSKTSRVNCCQNGGICVMGVFCHCPKNFFGFRCEHEMRSCGVIEHKAWARVGCHLCRCYDSELMCVQRAYSGCDDMPEKKEIKPSDYEEHSIYIFPPDKTTIDPFYSDYYDYKNNRNDQYYYDGDDTSSTSPPSSSSSSISSSSFYKIIFWRHNSPISYYSKVTILALLSLCVKYFNFLSFEYERIS